MTVYSNFGSKEGLFQAAVRERTGAVIGGVAGVPELDPQMPQKALMTIGARFLTLAREEGALRKFRSVYGVAGARPEACRAFYTEGPERLNRELVTYLRRTHSIGTLMVQPASGG